MAQCINKNSKEFINLAMEVNDNPITLAAKISVWQNENNTDEFPTVQELGIKKKKEPRLKAPLKKEVDINTLNKMHTFIEAAGIDLKLKDSLKDIQGNIIENALSNVNFLEGSINLINDIKKRPKAWNTLPEEVAHFWYELLENSTLKEDIDNYIKSTKNYKEEEARLKSLGYTDSSIFKEIVGKEIAKEIVNLDKNDNPEFKSLWDKILEFFSKLFNTYQETVTEVEETPITIAAEKILNSDLTDLMSIEQLKQLYKDYYGIVEIDEDAYYTQNEENFVTIQDTQWYHNLDKRFKVRKTLMPKTIEKIQANIDDVLSKYFNSIKKEKLTEKQLKQLSDNKYRPIVPELQSFKSLRDKYSKGIALKSPIKLPVKKEDLKILNTVRELLLDELPSNVKTVSPDTFIEEVQHYLSLTYKLGFAEEQNWLDYRIKDTFLSPDNTLHRKISLRFNDKYITEGSHFPLSPSAWGNITYFNSRREKDAVLIHEIQNDFFELLQRDNNDNNELDEETKENLLFKEVVKYMKFPSLFYSLNSNTSYQQFKELISEQKDLLKSVDYYKEQIENQQTHIDKLYRLKYSTIDFFNKTKSEDLFEKGFDVTSMASSPDGLEIYGPDGIIKKVSKEFAKYLDDNGNYSIFNLRLPRKLYSTKQLGFFIKTQLLKNIEKLIIENKEAKLSSYKVLNKRLSVDKFDKISKEKYEELVSNINKNIELFKEKGIKSDSVEIAEKELNTEIEIEKNYFNPLAHQLIQTIIKEKGRNFPIYFSGQEITMLTQGSVLASLIYAGPEEVSLKNEFESVKELRAATIKEYPILLDYFDEHGNKLKKVPNHIKQALNTKMYEMNGNRAFQIGPLYTAMSKLPGIKLEYYEYIPGFNNSKTLTTGGYKVNIDNYNFETPILFNLDENTTDTQLSKTEIREKEEKEEREEVKKAGSLNIERGFEKFFSKLDFSERTGNDYLNYLAEKKTDSVATTEDKIERMQRAFDAVVLIDTEMEESGKLLGVNNPISKRNGGKPVIVINPNKLFSDTVFHEFGHLYIDLLGGMSDPLVQDAIELLKGTTLWFKVADAYPELNAEGLAKEVLATALGVEGDILYRENHVKRGLWQQIKAAILNAISKLLGKNPNALEKLATEMLTNNIRVSSNVKFNTLIDQASKLVIDGEVTKKKIDNVFSYLSERFNLKEDIDNNRHYFDEETNTPHHKSVSQFAKSFSQKRYGNRKGDYTLKFDKGFELTKLNFQQVINSNKIPIALDMAMAEFFTGSYGEGLVNAKDNDEYWFTAYNRQLTHEFYDINDIIENNLEEINEKARENQREVELPLIAGNIVHKALEDYVNERVDFPENIIDPREKLIKVIKDIIKKGEANGSTFYSEQILYSETAKTPGTADLIEITKDNKFRIYDFKTMSSFLTESGKLKTNYQMYVGNGYLNQIMIYSTILKEYGIEPAENHLNFISIEIDKSEMDYDDPNSNVRIEAVKIGNIMELAATDRNMANHVRTANNKIIGAFRTPKKLSKKGDTIEEEIEEIDQLVNKLVRATKDFHRKNLDINEAYIIDTKMKKEIEKVMGKKNKQVILSYLKNVRDALTSVYGNSIDEDYLSAEYLRDLEFLVQVSSFLPDIRTFLIEQNDDYHIEHHDKADLIELLEETEDILQSVLKFQEFKTKEKAVEVLVANSNFMQGLWAEKFEMEAREKYDNPSKDKIKEYVYEELKKNADVIISKEFNYWSSVLKNGYTDIRYFEYLLADPGMNKSQFVQVAKNIMDKADMAMRIDLDHSIADLIKWHNSIDGYKGDPKKTWGKFARKATYEDINGEKQSHLSTTLISEKTSDYLELHLKYKYQLEYYERELLKAKKQNNTKKYKQLLEVQEKLREQQKVDRKKASTKIRNNPLFDKLSPKDKEILRYIHNKLEKADERLVRKHFSKLSYEVAGLKVHQLPKQRKSNLEASYEAKGALKRFKSGLMDYIRPPADEDELGLTEEEAMIKHDDFKTSSTDIVGNPLYEIPIYYRNQLEDPELQSFDIPTLLAMNEETTIQFEHYSLIEADLFSITQSLKNTKAHKTDAMINKRVVDNLSNGLTKNLNSPSNLTLKAVQSSIDNRLYKRTYKGIYSGANYKFIKGAETLNKVTSMILLSGNFGSASMTGLQGTIYRFIEGLAGEDFTMKDVVAGSRKAWADVPNMLADTQEHFPKSVTNLLIRRFGLETQFEALVNKFVQDSFITKNLDESLMYSVTSMAEQMVTASLMYTLLNNIKVMNSKGEFINKEGKKVTRDKAMSLDEAYSVKDGVLNLNKHVVYTEHNLTQKFKDNLNGEKTVAATEISRFIRSKYADLFGQYNQDMKSVAEMHVLGKLAFSMKKWIPRGYHRRWRGISSVRNTFEEMRDPENLEKRFYSQDQKKFQEGYYTTGLRFVYTMFKELKEKEISFMVALKNAHNQMTTHERANLIRVGAELGLMFVTWAAALLLNKIALSMEDDEENSDAIYFAAYLVERIKVESATFINPWELINNVKNPAAAVNTLTRIGDLIGQLTGVSYDKVLQEYDWEFNNRYMKGNRKGDLKIVRQIQNLIPFYKKASQFMGILGFDSKESIEDSFKYMIR